MVFSSPIDSIDRSILHALQIDGRVPFSRIAEVLGISEQTAARRFRALRSTARVRVVGMLDPAALGQRRWFVRMRCQPDAASAVADALARRSDTSWIHVTSGGTEIVCLTTSGPGQDTDALLLRTLPRTRQVVSVSAHSVLHAFPGGAIGPPTTIDALTPDQAARVARHAPARRDTPVQAGPEPAGEDAALVAALAHDGRRPAREIAGELGWTESRVRRRIAHLRGAGLLYFDLEIDPRALGIREETLLWLSVPPSRLDEVGTRLAGHREVVFVAATTGATNLLAIAACSDAAEFYRFLTGRVAALPGVNPVETAPIMRTVKLSGPLRPGTGAAAGARAKSSH